MSKLKTLGTLLGITIMAVTVWTAMALPTAAPGNPEDTSSLICDELRLEMEKNPELAQLAEKYAKVLQYQSPSPDELARLIAAEDSEEAKSLGIQIQYTNSADRNLPVVSDGPEYQELGLSRTPRLLGPSRGESGRVR